MAAADTLPGPLSSSDKRGVSTILVGLTCVTLLAIAIVHLRFVIPSFTAMLAGVNRSFSEPTRLALGIASFGALLVIALAGSLGALYWRGLRDLRQRRQFETALSFTALVLAAYVALLSWAYVDAAKALPDVRHGRDSATPASVAVRPNNGLKLSGRGGSCYCVGAVASVAAAWTWPPRPAA